MADFYFLVRAICVVIKLAIVAAFIVYELWRWYH